MRLFCLLMLVLFTAENPATGKAVVKKVPDTVETSSKPEDSASEKNKEAQPPKTPTETTPQTTPPKQPSANRIFVDDSGMRETVYFQIVFELGEQTKALAFEQDGHFYVLFDKSFDFPKLELPPKMVTLELVEKKDTYTLLKLSFVDPNLTPEFQKYNKGWKIAISPMLKDRPEPFSLNLKANKDTPQQLILENTGSGQLIEFSLGNQIYTAQVDDVYGMPQPHHSRAFDIVPTWVGLLLRKNNPEVSFSLPPKGLTKSILITQPRPFLVNWDLYAKENYIPSTPPRLLNLAKWDVDPQLTFPLIRSLQKQIIESKDKTQMVSKLKDLAGLYLSMGYYNEALSAARQIYLYEPKFEDPNIAFLHDLSLIMAHPGYEFDYPKTGEKLSGEIEYTLLEGIDLIRKNLHEKGLEKLALALKSIQGFPRVLRNDISLLGLESSLAINKPVVVFKNLITPSYLDMWDRDRFLYLDAKMQLLGKNAKAAIPILESLSQSKNRWVAFKSRMELIHANPIELQEGLEKLDALRFLWRGDLYEYQLLKQLADGYKQAKNFRKAILTKLTIQDFLPQFTDASKNLEEISGMVVDQLNQFPADKKIKKLAFYYEFDDYLPTDDQLVRIMANIVPDLLSVKLTGRAIDLLNNKIKLLEGLSYKTGDPDKYAPILNQIRMQLGEILLQNNQPQKALDVLTPIDPQKVTHKDQIKVSLLQARGLALLEKYDQAMQNIESAQNLEDYGSAKGDFDRLKGQIYMAQNQWADAVTFFEPLVLPLKEKADPSTIMNLAVCYAQQKNQPKMQELQNLCKDAFKDPNQKNAFMLLTTPNSDVDVSKKALESQIKNAADVGKVMDGLQKDYFK